LPPTATKKKRNIITASAKGRVLFEQYQQSIYN